jgi:GTP cyclohydrolase IA
VRPPADEPGFAMDLEKIERGIQMVLEGIGEDVGREGLRKTPERVAQMYAEILSGTHQDLGVLVPFFGMAHVAYIPSKCGKITGLSKLPRLVRVAAARLQLQERLTSLIADTLVEALEPEGVLVLVQAEHLCMSMRGVRTAGSQTVTSAVRGIFRTNSATRAEVLALIEAPRR